MIGLSHHTPAVISVLVQRESFKTHTILHKEDNWRQLLERFLDVGDTTREKVVFVDGVATLQMLKADEFDGLEDCKLSDRTS